MGEYRNPKAKPGLWSGGEGGPDSRKRPATKAKGKKGLWESGKKPKKKISHKGKQFTMRD